MTDNENWQKKPDEGGFSARRDGDRKPYENRGNSTDRPRFGGNNHSNDRPRFGGGGNSFDKPRPSYGDSGNSFDRPRRSFNEGGNSSDRPRFGGGGNYSDRPRFGDSNPSDRPRFGGNGNSYDKPRSFGGDSDRPRRSFNNEGGNSFDRPRRSSGENGNSFDKPRSSGSDSDRPRRPYNNEGGNNFDRPQRTFGDGEAGNSFNRPRPNLNNEGDRGNSFDKPRYNSGESGNTFDRPRRSYGDGDRGNSFDRPRSYGNNQDRPRPSFNNDGDRGNSFDRPRRGFNNDSGFKPRFNSGPSLPRPDRNDGRPRRPRIQKPEGGFDHGKPYGRPAAPNYPVFLDPDTPVRLNKYLANAGICSRREADEFIQAGVVRVNGEIISELGVKVKPTDTILFHDQQVSIEHKIYILLNKPKDCVTTSDDPQERTTVMDLVKGACMERIYPVGRLDRNTTGVLLLTNDGDLASKLTHPKYEKRKIYQVTLDKDIEVEDIQHILDGVTLDDCEVKADNCSYVDADKREVVGIEIHTGQNRVVRRIFESLGYKVFKLDRVYFAGLTKKNLPRGKWRHLSEKEVSLLKMGAFV
jgi:23S rRNA pseudouridine2605 synthase